MHEIITLQLGRQSNYVAAHFWNAQESYFTYGQDEPSPVDHDIHWRAGLGADGSETFLPRTLVYDRKGGFGSMRKINALYEDSSATAAAAAGSSSSLWKHGVPVVHRAPPIAPSAYMQSLEAGFEQTAPLTTSTVRYWSDYSRVFYHPRSLIEVGSEPEVDTSAADAGQPQPGAASATELTWAAGDALFSDLDREHDILDRDLRPFVEEADHMQGLQLIATVDDAWGGFAARYLERIRDEYGKTTVWLWALQDSVATMPRAQRLTRLANKARTYAVACSQASLVVPLAATIPSSQLSRRSVDAALDPRSVWHTSALLATAIETATLPSRLRHGRGGDSLAYLAEMLNASGKQTMASLQMSVAQPWKKVLQESRAAHDRDDRDDRDGEGDGSSNDPAALHLDVDFCPQDEPRSGVYASRSQHRKSARMFGQTVVVRSGDAADLEEADADADKREQSRKEARREAYEYDDRHPDPRDIAYRRFALKPVSQRYTVDLGFPLVDSFPRIYPLSESQPSTVAVATSLVTDSSVVDSMRVLRASVATPLAIGVEDREDLNNELAGLADAYHEGWSSGSDDGDDD